MSLAPLTHSTANKTNYHSFSIIHLNDVTKLTDITYIPTAFTDDTVQSQYHGGSPNSNVLLNAVTPSV